jgi:DNA-binding transcriptional regulator PaaX
VTNDTYDNAIDETVLSYFVQHGRSAVVTDLAQVAYITGLSKENVRSSLNRMEAAKRVVHRRDGSWILPGA